MLQSHFNQTVSSSQDPISLKRTELDPIVYESEELEVSCGVLSDSKLNIPPDHELPLEQILVQHYTFEVHLYLDGQCFHLLTSTSTDRYSVLL